MVIDYKKLEQEAEKKKTALSLEGHYVSLNESLKKSINELNFLHEIDKIISVPDEDIKKAAEFYEKIGNQLEQQFGVEVNTYPQGSTSTKTIIRSANNEDFDIDAVSEVLDYFPSSAISFFEKVGDILKVVAALDSDIKIEKKKRCWKVNLIGSGFYVDLIPAIPMSKSHALNESVRSFEYVDQYADDAVLIVNAPTREWQSSNPKGFRKWLLGINKRSSRLIFSESIQEGFVIANESVEDIPDQNIAGDDYLLLTIRLLKRHRDIMVFNNNLVEDYKPISVIICTLIAQTAQAMLDNGRSFHSYYDFLEDLIFKLPYMIGKDENGAPLIPNPTAPDENFADRWLEDRNAREKAFKDWYKDLKSTFGKISEVPFEDSFDVLVRAFGATKLRFDSVNRAIILVEPELGLTKKIPLTANKSVPDDGLA